MMVSLNSFISSEDFRRNNKNLSSRSGCHSSNGRGSLPSSSSSGWQREAWEVYDCIPEVKFACEYVGSHLSKVKFVVNRVVDCREVAAPEVEALNLMQSYKLVTRSSSGKYYLAGGLSQLIRTVAISLMVAGECWLVSRKDSPGFEVHRFDSVVERGGRLGLNEGAVKFVEFDERDTVLRVYKPHPANPSDSVSNVKSVLGQCKNLLALDKLLKSISRTNVNNGVFLIPNEIDFSSDDETDFVDRFYDHILSPIDEDESAAAVAPMVVEGSSQYLKDFKHLAVERKFDEHLKDLRDQEIERVARGLDLPTEIVMGVNDLNHWNSFGLPSAFIRSNAIPMLQLICETLTHKILRKALEKRGVKNASEYVVGFDEIQLVNQPNKTANALDAFKCGPLKDTALLKYLGFNEEDYDPDWEQRVQRTPRTNEGVQSERESDTGISER